MQRDLLRALTAAFGLDAGTAYGLTPGQHRAVQVLDEIRRDLVIDRPTFFEAFWSRRHAIRADPPRPKPAVTSGEPREQLPHDAHGEHEGIAMRLKDLPPTLSVEQAGQMLGIPRATAYRAAAAGQLPTFRIGRRLLVPTARLLDLLGIAADDHGDGYDAQAKP